MQRATAVPLILSEGLSLLSKSMPYELAADAASVNRAIHAIQADALSRDKLCESNRYVKPCERGAAAGCLRSCLMTV